MPYFAADREEARFRQLALAASDDAEGALSPISPLAETPQFWSSRSALKVVVCGGCAVAAVAAFKFHVGSGKAASVDFGSVQELDEEASCVDKDEDCRASKCCNKGGQICFAKNEWWAVCLDECTPGVPRPNDPSPEAWSCEPLGDKAPMPLTCTWAGEDCSQTKECCQRGFQCTVKDEYWSTCAQLEQGPWEADGTPTAKVPLNKAWKGTRLGGWRSEHELQPQAGAGLSSSLFCFMAILTGSAEEKLVDLAWDRKSGIFGCEDSRIYHSAASKFHKWNTGQSTLANTDIFIEIWNDVKVEGKYKHQDWTVKADADCIFFPDRLRIRLQGLKAPAGAAIYVKNTLARYTNGGFLGAIEVFSSAAVEKFSDHAKECATHIGVRSGEDGFLKDCMDALGIGFMSDELIMHPSGLAADCQVKEFASYHPFKSNHNWTTCYDVALGTIAPPALFGGSIELFPESIRGNYR